MLRKKNLRQAKARRRSLQFQTLEPRLALAAQPIISEFLASNDDGLLDDNGNSSDWIEIFNAGNEAVDLSGYTLTDNANDISKWTFPSVTLLPNRHLVVFAGVDVDPSSGTNLYTGFGLSSAGEYVGLYDPSGNVLSEFGTGGVDYPAQREDVSYGLETLETLSTPVAVGALSQYLVPSAVTGPQVADLWRQPDYVLGTFGESWQAGASGFGYERGAGYEPFIATDLESSMYNQTASAYIRSTFTQDSNDPVESLTLRARYEDGFVAYLNGVEVLRENGPTANGLNTNSIPLDNLFDDPKGTPLADAIVSDAYQAEATASDLGVYTVELGNLNQDLAITPGVTFNLSSAGGGSGSSGGISNDTFRSQSTGAIRTLGLSSPPNEKVEDGIGIHSNGLITFDINELRTAGGFTGQAGYFTTRSGINDTAGSAGDLNTVAILSDDSGQVLAGYVNGQQVALSNSGGTWFFSGEQPSSLRGSGDNRFAPIAMPVPVEAAYLTLAVTGNGVRSSDHGAFSNPRLEFQSIALGNLFDDAKGTPLTTAISTDAPQSRGDTSDLGVISTGDGSFQSIQAIAPLVSFDLSNVGSSTVGNGNGASNDTWSSEVDRPIRTRNINLTALSGTLIEDGIGLVADEYITFDIEELRIAGGYSSDLEFRFKARAGINDEASVSASGLAVVLACDALGNVVGGWVNGEATALTNTGGVWSLDFPNGPPAELTASDAAVDLDLALPSNTAYVTIVSAGGQTTTNDDRMVFSGARLSATPDADGVNWESVSGASRPDADAIIPRAFDLSGSLNLLRDGDNVLAIHALNRSTTSSDFLFSHEIVTGDLSYTDVGRPFHLEPTPGAFNSEGVEDFVENVSFSVERGFYDAPISVALTTPTASASIYYTTDGSLPGPDNPTSTLYSSPVNISTTTTLRSAAYRTNYAPSYIDTQTYVYVEDVIQQDPLNLNGNGVSPDNGLVYPVKFDADVDADYALDPQIINDYDDNDPANLDFGIRESLRSLPTFSLTLDHGDAFRPVSDDFPGIVTDATNRGEGFRHAASIEYFDPASGDHFQANAAVQAQGNSSRSSGSTRQHSYRLIFNETLGGPGKFRFPLFDNSDFADINTFTLKVASTDGFSHDSRGNGSNINPLNSTYTRDAFVRQLHFNTGNPAADGTFAHVYINGLYWGLYTPIERPDDAFFSSRFGGEREDWDIFRDNDEFISGTNVAWNQMRSLIAGIGNAAPTQADFFFQQLQGKNFDGTNDPNREALMDVDNFIDYMAIHFANNTSDWPHRNWYAARNRVNPGDGFQFIAWDQGQSLAQDFADRTERQGGLGTLHRQLRSSPEYRLRFADRIQKQFFNDGALTLQAMQQTWSDLADEAEPGIVAETARWGDSREGEFSNAFENLVAPPGAPTHPLYPPGFATTVPTLTIDNWRTNVNFVHDDVLPFAHGLFFDRMLVDGLWINNVSAPSLALNGTPQHGGAASAGDSLSLTGAGTIYFTIDGTDPRAFGGTVAGTEYTTPLTLDATTVVKARSFNGNDWSPLTEATFALANGSVAISEINYNPYDPTAAEIAEGFDDADDFQFIEIMNTSATATINLDGSRLADGVNHEFGNVSLEPGERVAVVEDTAAFRERYGLAVRVVGQWGGKLSGSGETIQLLDGLDNEIQSITYNDSDPWSVAADGKGATLVLDDPVGTPADRLGKSYSWRGSAEFGGTPGAASSALAGIVVNEVLAHTDLPLVDSIELFNPTNNAIDVSGWFLSDDGDTPLKFQIPSDTVLGSGQYLTFDENDFNIGASAFALDSAGDQVYLTDPTGTSLRFVDAVEFGATFNVESVGRVPNGAGRLAPMVANSLGVANSRPRIGELVITEVNYHPADPSPSAQSAFDFFDNSDAMLIDNDLEFIEIHNPTPASISLENWRLRGESDFDFASTTTLAAGETLVVVSFDPDTDIARLAGFRAQYGIGSEVTLVGGFDQNLSNGEARIELQQPDIGLLNPTEITHVTADEVLYDDLGPWPIATNGTLMTVDGGGATLERVGPTFYGNAANSWLAAASSPGTVDFTPDLLGDYDRNCTVEEQDFKVWRSSYGNPLALNADGNGDGTIDAADYTVWRSNLGATLPATIVFSAEVIDLSNAVEPASLSFAATQEFASPVLLEVAAHQKAFTPDASSADEPTSNSPESNLLLLLAIKLSASESESTEFAGFTNGSDDSDKMQEEQADAESLKLAFGEL